MALDMELDINKIHPNPRNKNVHTLESVTRLANNIKAYGLINPILVHPIGREQYQIVTGEGRWKAFKELKRRTIPSRVMDAGTKEIMIDGMRLSENRIRTFDLVAECQELANLHRQGKSIEVLAQDFGESKWHIGDKIAVGYFPENLLGEVRKGTPRAKDHTGATRESIWSMNGLNTLLPLRRPKRAIAEIRAQGGRTYSAVALDDAYDYREIERAIHAVNRGEISLGTELGAYVAKRRLELIEAEQESLFQTELNARLKEIQTGLEQKLQREVEAIKSDLASEHQTKLDQLQTQLSQAVGEAQKVREERARLEADHTAELRRVREEIAAAHRKELATKEQSFSSQIERLQKDLQQAREAQASATQEAEAKLRREYDRKITAAEAVAGKTKEEIEQSQQTIVALRTELQEKIAEREAEIRVQYEEQANEKLAQIQSVVAERDRWKQEAESLGKQLERQADRVTELEKSYQERISEKEGEIVSRDGRIAELLQMRSQIETELGRKSKEEAQREAERIIAEYQVTLQKEFEEKLAVLEQSYVRREQELALKTNKTLDDAINRFMQVTNEVDASVRLLVYDYLEHFSQQQLVDLSVRMQWVHRKVSEALNEIEKLQGETIDISSR